MEHTKEPVLICLCCAVDLIDKESGYNTLLLGTVAQSSGGLASQMFWFYFVTVGVKGSRHVCFNDLGYS